MKKKICIISEYAYPYFKFGGEKSGGAELQMFLLSKELSKNGHNIDFIVFDSSNTKKEYINGVNLHIPYNIKNKGITHLYPHNLVMLYVLLSKIGADIYIQRAGSPLTGIIALYAHLKNKKFIFSVSSDSNVSDQLHIKHIKDLKKIFYIFGIKYANCIICQTKHQQKILMKNISKKGFIIKNISSNNFNKSNSNEKTILWVGRIIKEKNPEIFLKLAENLPQYSFKMIGGSKKGGSGYYNHIKNLAMKITNLEFLGFIPNNEIHTYYSKAIIFINTSNSEGFPNTFLESWANSTPIVSLKFDPDKIIFKNKLGLISDDFNELSEDCIKLITNNDLRIDLARNGLNYVNKFHNSSKIIKRYEKLFNIILKQTGDNSEL